MLLALRSADARPRVFSHCAKARKQMRRDLAPDKKPPPLLSHSTRVIKALRMVLSHLQVASVTESTVTLNTHIAWSFKQTMSTQSGDRLGCGVAGRGALPGKKMY